MRWLYWQRGTRRRSDTWVVVGFMALLLATLAASQTAWWILLAVAAGTGKGLHDAWRVPERSLLRLDCAPQPWLAGQGFDGPLRLRWLDAVRVVLACPHRVIYADECSPAQFAALRRIARGVERAPEAHIGQQ